MTNFTLPIAVAFLSVTLLVSTSFANEKNIQLQEKPAAVHNNSNNAVSTSTQPTVPPIAPSNMPMPTHMMHGDKEHATNAEVNFANFTKPDTSLADQVVESINKHDFASFEKSFAKSGYSIFTLFDKEITSNEMMKSFWNEMFGERGCMKSSNFSVVHGAIQAPYPGVAILNSKIKFHNEGKETQGLMNITMKYEADGWKISSLHLTSYEMIKNMVTKESRMMVEHEYNRHLSKQMGLFLPFVFGLVLGSAIMFAYLRRKKRDLRK